MAASGATCGVFRDRLPDVRLGGAAHARHTGTELTNLTAATIR